VWVKVWKQSTEKHSEASVVKVWKQSTEKHSEASVGESLKEEYREAFRGKCGWKSERRVQRSIPWSVCVLRSVQGLSYLDRSTKTLHLKGTHVLPVIVWQSPFIDTNPPFISWFSLFFFTSQKPPRRGRSRHRSGPLPQLCHEKAYFLWSFNHYLLYMMHSVSWKKYHVV
jgi:hypothetical protein